MITTFDDSFSYIELTEIGKEYYAKGRKFKSGETKGFTMYFDLTAGNHSNAKTLFSNWLWMEVKNSRTTLNSHMKRRIL